MPWHHHPELRYFRTEIENAAHVAGLDPALVGAVVLTESSGYTNAYRYEPKFWERYQLSKKPEYANANPRRVSASYGLLQILYPTAHELGHLGCPEELFGPTIGLRFGCVHLRRCLDWAAQFTQNEKEQVVIGLAAYNGGRSSAQKPPNPLNVQYSLRVLKNLELLK